MACMFSKHCTQIIPMLALLNCTTDSIQVHTKVCTCITVLAVIRGQSFYPNVSLCFCRSRDPPAAWVVLGQRQPDRTSRVLRRSEARRRDDDVRLQEAGMHLACQCCNMIVLFRMFCRKESTCASLASSTRSVRACTWTTAALSATSFCKRCKSRTSQWVDLHPPSHRVHRMCNTCSCRCMATASRRARFNTSAIWWMVSWRWCTETTRFRSTSATLRSTRSSSLPSASRNWQVTNARACSSNFP